MHLPLELCERDLVVDRDHCLDEIAVERYFGQVAAALMFCHQNGVFHLDVKPDNILVTEDGVVKLADFGCALMVQHGRANQGVCSGCCRTPAAIAPFPPVTMTRHECGTTIYAAPEALRCRDIRRRLHRTLQLPGAFASVDTGDDSAMDASHSGRSIMEGAGFDAGKADVWSLGISMLVCITGYFPWECARESNRFYMKWVAECSSHGAAASNKLAWYLCSLCKIGTTRRRLASVPLMGLVVSMLNPSVKKRVSMHDVMQWFRTPPPGGLLSEENVSDVPGAPPVSSTPHPTTFAPVGIL